MAGPTPPPAAMLYLLTIQIDQALVAALPEAEYAEVMRDCIEYADVLAAEGTLLMAQQLESPSTARTLRTRNGRSTVTDGPFTETRELLAGFNLVRARSPEHALDIARGFPWSRFGSIEIRPVRDMDRVRERAGTGAKGASAG